ncbi:hypothetical protein FA13DRAFT_1759736 [Coprinellus micaceus]|uniref:J domain-containing protein n=1 Tax=Coprinellus micaceus TaxID=71717 RepID=A0A4Y7RRE6_COPMI|nr:hypothetical protein FA13DRAFT_1759736 [Coprinellus micaceus]
MTTIFPSTRLKFVSGLPRVECQRRSLSSTSRRKSHYETLGIPNDASKAQIKLNKFTKLNEAYQVLISDRERRAYDRSLLHRGPSGDHYQRYTPHSPPSKSHERPTHGRERTYTYSASSNPFQAGRKPPPPDYDFTAGRQRPGPNPYHDVLSGSRKRYEEAERAADLVRNESFFLRAVQLTGVIAVPILLLGGFGPGVW